MNQGVRIVGLCRRVSCWKPPPNSTNGTNPWVFVFWGLWGINYGEVLGVEWGVVLRYC